MLELHIALRQSDFCILVIIRLKLFPFRFLDTWHNIMERKKEYISKLFA